MSKFSNHSSQWAAGADDFSGNLRESLTQILTQIADITKSGSDLRLPAIEEQIHSAIQKSELSQELKDLLLKQPPETLLSLLAEHLHQIETRHQITVLKELRESIKKAGYLTPSKPKVLNKLLISSFHEEDKDIFTTIEKSTVMEKHEKRMWKAALVSCTQIRIFFSVILRLMGVDVKGADVPGHALLLIPRRLYLPYAEQHRYLFADFSLDIFIELELADYYEQQGKCWYLRRILRDRIDSSELRKLKKEFGDDHSGLIDQLEKRYHDHQSGVRGLLSIFYPRIQIMEIHEIASVIYNNIGCVYLKLGLYEKAIARFERAIEIADNVDSYHNLYHAYQKVGNSEKARRTWQKVCEIDPFFDRNEEYWVNYFTVGAKRVDLSHQ